jgi:hypothetical protein
MVCVVFYTEKPDWYTGEDYEFRRDYPFFLTGMG